MVVETGELEQVQRAAGGARLGICGAEDYPRQPHVHDRAGTHRAWLFRHVQRAIRQPPIADGLFGLGQRQHLSVGRGVFEQFNLVVRPGDNAASLHDHRADGHFLGRIGSRASPMK